MEINMKLVGHIAGLSRIDLTEKEKEEMLSELSQIVNYMVVLKALDTDNVEELSHVFPIKNVMRDDVIKDSLPCEEILRNASVSNDESFVVPKTVE